MTDAEKVISVRNLTKVYGKFVAIDDVNFDVRAGEIVGLLGPNGAGKTTMVHMLLGLLEPTKGEIEIFGKSISKHKEEISQNLNFAATYLHFPGALLVWENLYVFAMLYGMSNIRERIKKLLETFKLSGFSRVKTGFLSSGEQTRFALAKSFINEPKLLLLDEPTASLDPKTAEEMRSIILAETDKRNMAILWTSHNMREIERVCDKALFLSHGKILAQGSVPELISRFGKNDLEEVFIELAPLETAKARN